MAHTSQRTASFNVLGVRVDAVQIPDVVSRMEEWIEQCDTCRYIAVTDMHSLMQAQHAASFKKILENADLVVPDGFPLVWLGRRKGFPLRRRVYGPELMERFCEETSTKGIAIFFTAAHQESRRTFLSGWRLDSPVCKRWVPIARLTGH